MYIPIYGSSIYLSTVRCIYYLYMPIYGSSIYLSIVGCIMYISIYGSSIYLSKVRCIYLSMVALSIYGEVYIPIYGSSIYLSMVRSIWGSGTTVTKNQHFNSIYLSTMVSSGVSPARSSLGMVIHFFCLTLTNKEGLTK